MDLSCDFDEENLLSLPARKRKREYVHNNDASNATRRKGGTFCMFKPGSHPSGSASWRIDSRRDVRHKEPGQHFSQLSQAYAVHEDEETGEETLNRDATGDENVLQSTANFAEEPVVNYFVTYSTTSANLQSAMGATLASPFFLNPLKGVCMTFRYLFHSQHASSQALLVYLLSCNSGYRIPVLNLTQTESVNGTNLWQRGAVPLPDYQHPYQVIFEIKAGPTDSLISASIDDVVFSACGECCGVKLAFAMTRWNALLVVGACTSWAFCLPTASLLQKFFNAHYC